MKTICLVLYFILIGEVFCMGRSYKTLKVFLRILVFVFLFLVVILPGIIFISLKIPSVQQYVLNKVTAIASEKIHSKVNIDKVDIFFLHGLKLKGIYIEDQRKDTLAYVGDLDITFNLTALFHKKISFSEVELNTTYLNVYRNSGEKGFNYTFLVNAFSDTSGTSSDWEIDLGELELKNIRLDYKDVPGGTNVNTRLTSLNVDFKNIGIDDNHLIVNKAIIDGLSVAVNLSNPEMITTQDTSSGAAMKVTVKELILEKSALAYNDFTQKAIKKGMDFNRLDLKMIKGNVKDIRIAGSDVQLLVNSFSFKEKSGFTLNDLAVKADITSSLAEIDLRKVTTPVSHLSHSVFFTIPLDKKSDLSMVAFKGSFKDEAVAMKDLQYFFSGLDTIPQLKNKQVKFSGSLKGNLKDFNFNNAFIGLDKNDFIKGDMKIKGLPDLAQAEMNIAIKDLNINSALISSFLPPDSTINIKALGNINVKGSIIGKAINPKADLAVHTGSGDVNINTVVRMDTSFNFQAFNGKIKTTDFNVQKVMRGSIPISNISLEATVEGVDNDISNLRSDISSLKYNGYIYHDLSINGSLINNDFKAGIISKDSNLIVDLRLKGNINKPSYDIQGTVDNADLYALNFSDSILTVGAKIDVAFEGINIDSIKGKARLKNIAIHTSTENFSLDSLIARADLMNGIRTVDIISPIADLKLSGHFIFEEIPTVFNFLLSNYYPSLASKTNFKLEKTTNLDFSIRAGSLSSIVGFFDPSIKILDSLDISGSFNKSDGMVRLNSSLAKINFSGIEIDGLKLSASGEGSNLEFKAEAKEVKPGNNLVLDKPLISGVLEKGTLSFNVKLHDQQVSTRLNLNGVLTQQKDTFYLAIPSADIFVKGRKWEINKGNKIVYANNFLRIHDFELTEGDQKISLRSLGKENSLEALFNNVRLQELLDMSGLTGYKVSGLINGKIVASNVLSDPGFNADVNIDSLYLNSEELGILKLVALKNTGDAKINLNVNLSGKNNNASVKGYYNSSKEGSADLYLHIGQMHLHPLEPFVKQFAFQLQGMLSGNFHLVGSLSNPALIGQLNFDGFNRVGLTATNTIYRINNQQIVFQESAIKFDHFAVTDSLQNKAIANGAIYYENFDHFKFDLSFDTDKFELVNSDYAEDAALYGKLWANMHVTVNGPLESLAVKVNAVTLKGTKLFIPLATSQSSAVTPAYVHFHKIEMDTVVTIKNEGAKDSLRKEFVNTKVDLSKFDISGHLRVTKEAELNIIVDPANGDKITAIGEGTFSFDFNSANEINIFGTYIIDKGSYAFTFVNLIKKNFKIEKGSSISWSGNPMNASLDITAIYETKASRYELVQDQMADMSKEQMEAAKHPMPVDVNLSLKGPLETPDISFKIEVPEGEDPLNGSIVAQEINKINSDPNQLNKEVFSLIITNKFIGTGGNNSITNSGSSLALNEVNKSVSRILNSQLNKLSDDYLKGIDINVNLQSLDQSYGAFAQNAEVTASKKISPRITVSAGGNVNINSNYGSSQFAGDYYIYYRVNSSGSVNLKFFRTSQQNLYTNNLYTNQGFSVTYRKDFNGWKNIFNEARRKEEEE